jgi:hypothetical protein
MALPSPICKVNFFEADEKPYDREMQLSLFFKLMFFNKFLTFSQIKAIFRIQFQQFFR